MDKWLNPQLRVKQKIDTEFVPYVPYEYSPSDMWNTVKKQVGKQKLKLGKKASTYSETRTRIIKKGMSLAERLSPQGDR